MAGTFQWRNIGFIRRRRGFESLTRYYWGVVQRQDSRFWLCLSGFESLRPNQLGVAYCMDRRAISDEDLRVFVEVVQRFKREGLTVTEIAERLGIHRNTVNWRLRRWRTTHPTT